MSLFDEIGGLLSNVTSGNLSGQQVNEHYDQIAQAVPQSTLASMIGPALANLEGGQLQQGVANSAQQMNPQQRGNIVQTLLSGLGGSSGSNLTGLLGQLGINQSVATNPQSATPDEVAKLAAHTQTANPGVFQDAMSFYSEHPTLVKALGTVAISAIASHMSQGLH